MNFLHTIGDAADRVADRVTDLISDTTDKATEMTRNKKRRDLIEQLMILHTEMDGPAAETRADQILSVLYPK